MLSVNYSGFCFFIFCLFGWLFFLLLSFWITTVFFRWVRKLVEGAADAKRELELLWFLESTRFFLCLESGSMNDTLHALWGFWLEAGSSRCPQRAGSQVGTTTRGLKMFHLEFTYTHAGPIPVSRSGFCRALPCTGCIPMLHPIRMLGIETFQPRWKQCPCGGCHSLTVSARRGSEPVLTFHPSFVYTLCWNVDFKI